MNLILGFVYTYLSFVHTICSSWKKPRAFREKKTNKKKGKGRKGKQVSFTISLQTWAVL